MKVYASIHIGSYGISLKVFEISKQKGIRKLDSQRRRMELAAEILKYNRISDDNLTVIIDTVLEMKQTMETYRTDAYNIYAGNALEKADNIQTLMDQIRIVCGMDIEILDNSMQRFLLYEALCSMSDFSDIVKGTSILLDVGGSGVQLTLFSKGVLETTQHVYVGAANVWEDMKKLRRSSNYREQILRMIQRELETFYRTFLHGNKPDNLIIINNPIVSVNRARAKNKDGHLSAAEYIKLLKKAYKDASYGVSPDDTTEEISDIRMSFLMMYRSVMEQVTVEDVYVPPISLHEGMAYDYAYSHRLLKRPRDFDNDVLSASWAIARRYDGDTLHLERMRSLSEMLFEAIKRRHLLPQRSRLMLMVAAILHDCGKFISIANAGECSRVIIQSSEILGLSDKDRQIISWICACYRNNGRIIPQMREHFSQEECFFIQKLSSILAIAGALDTVHEYSDKDIRIRMNEKNELVITLDTQDSLALEKGMFSETANAFRAVFAIKPVLKSVRIRRSPA